jgi:exosortase
MSAQTEAGPLEEFRVEFQEAWRRLPNKGLFFGLLAAWLALFHVLGNSTLGYVKTGSLLGWMWNAWRSNDWDEGHGALIPAVVLVLLWWKRRELLASPLRLWWPGLALVAASLLLHLAGYLVQQPRVSIVGLFGGIYGLMGLAWGWRFLQASFFPFCLFVFCIPFGSLAEKVTFPLRMLVTRIAVGVSQAVGFEVVREGSLIYDVQRTFRFDVAPACSGIRSLVALLALTTIFGFVAFRSPWRRLVMMAAAFPLAVLGNATRIIFTIFVTELLGQKYGVAVEQKFGFVTFAVAIACVLVLERWLREPAVPAAAGAAAPAGGQR